MNPRGGHQEVAKMAWPLAVGLLSFTLMGLTDTLLMGHVSTVAQAGVGLGAIIALTAIAFLEGLVSGPQVLVAAADGAGDRTRVEQAGGASLAIGVVGGLLGTAGLWLFLEVSLTWLADDVEVAAASGAYLHWRLIGLPVTMVALAFAATLQGLGDTRTQMWASLAGNGANIILDLVLIFGWGPFPDLGAAGAGIATVGSSLLMMLIYGWHYRKRLGVPRLPSAEVFRSAMALGIPAGMESLLTAGSFAVLSVVMAMVGPTHLAANQIAINIVSLSLLPGYGISEAGGILVGRYLGGGDRATAARVVRSARWLAVSTMGAFAVVFALGGAEICSLFTLDPEVARIAGSLMLFAAVFQIFDAIAMTHLSALRSAGDARFTLWVTTVTALGLTVPFAVGFGLWLGWGAPVAWCGLTVEIGVLAAVTGWRIRGLEAGRIGRIDLLLGTKSG